MDKLNSRPGTWKAKVYDHLVGKSYAELRQTLGKKKAYKGKERKHMFKTNEANKAFVQTGTSYGDLPKSFSWAE